MTKKLVSHVRAMQEVSTSYLVGQPVGIGRDHFVSRMVEMLDCQSEREAMAEASFDYVAEASKTLSPRFHGELITRARALQVLNDFAKAAAELDKVKKALFYGRKDFYDGTGFLGRVNGWGLLNDMKVITVTNDVKQCLIADTDEAANLLHGIVGVATEAGELVEALLAALGGEPLDLVNLKEESGDLKWYLAILAKEAGFEWGEDERTNIAKLRARFPKKFTEERANSRDLDRERSILETGAAPIGSNVGLRSDLGLPLEHAQSVPNEAGREERRQANREAHLDQLAGKK